MPPKFDYPTLTTETYNGQRWYIVNGKAFPSITTVLGFTEPPEKKKALESWRNNLGFEKANEFSKKAADRGTNVHLLAERYLKNEKVDSPINGRPVPNADLQSFNALKFKLDKINEIWGQEVALYSKTLEVCGRTDLVGLYKGVPVIVDFKTSGKIKSKADIGNYELQLLMYATAHNEMFGTDIQQGVILMVAETGFPMEFIIPFNSVLMEKLKSRVQEFWTTTINKL